MKLSSLFALWRVIPPSWRGLIRTMRLTQWTKNGFVFIPILFDRQITRPESFVRVLLAFFLFCLISSAVYVLNDLVDVEKDRLHPKKKLRAIPSGQLPIRLAQAAAALLPLVALGGAVLFSPALALVIGIYYLKNIAYSFALKNIVLIDVLVVAAGFILRVIGGTVVITITSFSPWLYLVAGMLALFLAVGKRRQELILLAEGAKEVRTTYKEYTLPLLDDMLRMVTTGSIMAYTLYTIEAPTNLGGRWMMLTIPIAIYGIFRYLYLIHVRGEGGAPDELLFKDRPLLIAVMVFVLMVGLVIYVFPRLFPIAGAV
ncbi:MAG TPA: decaprenyl-phosphate phosphoribosyltransferase [Aggregatilineales bacterium]|nr:decaprenyl-phosphate phosphoribosyltransferase [Anaerolineales bacterium]HRE46329.1 decaprenyl-phosphate phosphoribosyltransferase [Aggregatilineales bacterium]